MSELKSPHNKVELPPIFGEFPDQIKKELNVVFREKSFLPLGLTLDLFSCCFVDKAVKMTTVLNAVREIEPWSVDWTEESLIQTVLKLKFTLRSLPPSEEAFNLLQPLRIFFQTQEEMWIPNKDHEEPAGPSSTSVHLVDDSKVDWLQSERNRALMRARIAEGELDRIKQNRRTRFNSNLFSLKSQMLKAQHQAHERLYHLQTLKKAMRKDRLKTQRLESKIGKLKDTVAILRQKPGTAAIPQQLVELKMENLELKRRIQSLEQKLTAESMDVEALLDSDEHVPSSENVSACNCLYPDCPEPADVDCRFGMSGVCCAETHGDCGFHPVACGCGECAGLADPACAFAMTRDCCYHLNGDCGGHAPLLEPQEEEEEYVDMEVISPSGQPVPDMVQYAF